MESPDFVPAEGGVKVVFDVSEVDVEHAVSQLFEGGFAVRRYYDVEPEVGGPRPGHIRLGAERPLRTFTDDEVHRAEADFEALMDGVPCERAGTDQWVAG